MKLDLPGRVPLPDDVRWRALDTVLAGLDEAPPRRRRERYAPLLVAAAVVVALVLSVSVALGWRVGPGLVPAAPPVPGEGVPGPMHALPDTGPPGTEPVQSAEPGPATPDEARARCVATAPAGVVLGDATDVYPLGSDTVVVLGDAVPCLVTPDSVTLPPATGTPLGDGVSAVRLGPAVAALLNPEARSVEVTPAEGLVTLSSAPESAVHVLLFPGIDLMPVTVAVDGAAGPLPDPAPPLVSQRDRTLSARVPGSAEANDLEACLAASPPWAHSRGELWQPVLRHDPGGGRPPVLVARIGSVFGGFCTLAADGPSFDWGVLEAGPVLVAPSGEWENALLVTPAGTADVLVDGAACTAADGIAFCTGVDEDQTAVVVAEDGGRTEVPLSGG